MLEHYQQVHELDDACRMSFCIGIIFKQHFAGCSINKYCAKIGVF